MGVAGIALLLPFTPIAPLFHLAPPPAVFYVWLLSMVGVYLAIVEIAKRLFYRLVDREQGAVIRQL